MSTPSADCQFWYVETQLDAVVDNAPTGARAPRGVNAETPCGSCPECLRIAGHTALSRAKQPPFKARDVVTVTTKNRLEGPRTFDAHVAWVERRARGWYFGYVPVDFHCAWGCMMLFDVPRPFGVQSFTLKREYVPSASEVLTDQILKSGAGGQ